MSKRFQFLIARPDHLLIVLGYGIGQLLGGPGLDTRPALGLANATKPTGCTTIETRRRAGSGIFGHERLFSSSRKRSLPSNR